VSEVPLLRLVLPDHREATLLLSTASTVLSVEETDVSSWDLSGRPYALVRQDGTYRRALDGHLLHKREARSGSPRLRQRLTAAEGAPVVQAARGEAASAIESLSREGPIESIIPMSVDEFGDEGPIVEDALRRLRNVMAMDTEGLAADAARFSTVVGRVGILPPDQYLSLVVRGTEGCSWNGCTFCGLYRDVPFRWRTPEELRKHVAGVRAYFGESIALRRSVFLGDANALCLGHEHLVPLLQVVASEFPGRPVFSFVDAASGRRKPADDWLTYAALGLRRVYVGLETGDPDLLAWLGKPGSPASAVDLVRTLHEAGLGVGVIVLVGAGGDRFSNGHVDRTAEVLGAMRLRRDDFLYFAEFVPDPALEYGRRAEGSPDLEPLSPDRCSTQQETILSTLHLTDPGASPHTASYDIREFVY
jgi:radical SAM superfamily enzyme YgiQ (UPF0313 family)